MHCSSGWWNCVTPCPISPDNWVIPLSLGIHATVSTHTMVTCKSSWLSHRLPWYYSACVQATFIWSKKAPKHKNSGFVVQICLLSVQLWTLPTELGGNNIIQILNTKNIYTVCIKTLCFLVSTGSLGTYTHECRGATVLYSNSSQIKILLV